MGSFISLTVKQKGHRRLSLHGVGDLCSVSILFDDRTTKMNENNRFLFWWCVLSLIFQVIRKVSSPRVKTTWNLIVPQILYTVVGPGWWSLRTNYRDLPTPGPSPGKNFKGCTKISRRFPLLLTKISLDRKFIYFWVHFKPWKG